MTTQEQGAMTYAKDMTTQANWEVVPRPHQQVITMVSPLRDFTLMNTPTFYRFNVDEDPK